MTQKQFLYGFQSKLKEGEICVISKFNIISNGGDYRTSMHAYKCKFKYIIEIQEWSEILKSHVRYKLKSWTPWREDPKFYSPQISPT